MATSFAKYLAGLPDAELTELLEIRSDTRIDPAPVGFEQLAQRLCGPESLTRIMLTLDRDAIVVSQLIATLDRSASRRRLADLLGAGELLDAALDRLSRAGLVWPEGTGDDGILRAPDLVTEYWTAELGTFKPLARIAADIPVTELRTTAAGLGIAIQGLRKPELIEQLTEAMSDLPRMIALIRRLPEPVKAELDLLLLGDYFGYSSYGANNGSRLLAQAGLVVLRYGSQPVLPMEVARAARVSDQEFALTGRPDLSGVRTDRPAPEGSAQAAAQEAVRGITGLLDAAGVKPIKALKNGGVGKKERSRLARELAIPDDAVALWIDLAHAAGLFDELPGGYGPTDRYPDWRDADPAMRWAVVADAWFALEHAPTSRETDDDREQPPPLPMGSWAGQLRRALLTAAEPGIPLPEIGRHVGWICPLNEYDDEGAERKIAATVREAELLGVAVADLVTEPGRRLTEVRGLDIEDRHSAIAESCGDWLPATPCRFAVQSDLTAVVSGQPSAELSRLLTIAADSEARGGASVWRFTPASVRAALDAGWRAEDLLAKLRAWADHELPQPLEYLIADVARRYGHVRVRGAIRSCVVADEALLTEILHTRSLAKLGFSRLAPTVLASDSEPGDLLAALRTAGYLPVEESADGTVVVAGDPVQRPSLRRSGRARNRPKRRLSAAELVRSLRAAPAGQQSGAAKSGSYADLARLNPRLAEAELVLLAHATDQHADVRIAYRNQAGNRSVREIRPERLYGKWLDSWCHLRNDQRDFTVANIEAVSPIG
jgi:hypothetical protein